MEVKSDFPMKFGNPGTNLIKFIGISSARLKRVLLLQCLIKLSPKCRTFVKRMSHFVFSFHKHEIPSNSTNFKTLPPHSDYGHLTHFVLSPLHLGYLRNFLAEGDCAAGVVSIVIPRYVERWGFELNQYLVYARFVLIDTETGYRSQSQDYSKVISAIS